jgi:SAM-dependent methyltransferase
VLGADIAERSIGRARERITAAGVTNAEVVTADVSTHPFPPQSFDLAFSRFGVMFFADPIASFANVHRALKPDGRLTIATFRTSAENRWSSAALEAVRHLLPPIAPPAPEAPGQFSWADPARVRRILEGAGFREVTLTPHDPPMRVAPPGGAAEAADFSLRIGPVVRPLIGAPDAQREAVRAGLEEFFERHDGPEGVVLPGAIWVISARV